ncbi:MULTISPECIES: anhydro-N-acetylmuramic acid kinase [unclassified Synechococcus]|uniref:anhydro-N-acetylmuramic acid kinase n=1 Tax=unclassified Synechococcus TaxID=2626047 RepID=UPI0018CF94D0|nr:MULTISPECIES: anhydro-N-acetylmuramic acid kinase [unclassified Synechococcus]QPN67998.1 anhydro-N-acetylmuramic acid kinase [Synechococcus sp. CBW1006]CAK6690038.1 Anhydro-N-acetylmuramic acid kinase [Synechococcus sp. CBW1107]
MRVVGLMSGTSADGVDAVLAAFSGPPQRPRWQLLGRASVPYPDDLRQRLLALGQGASCTSAELLDLSEAVTEVQAEAARHADPGATAALVGCHGQTLWHRPPTGDRRGASLQLLQGTLLASLLQRPVVHDFRAADLALGGQGAPLVPPCDAALLGSTGGWRALLNLGGIANLTLLPPRHGPDRHASVRGWDCGPANTLLDLAVEQFSQGQLSFDDGGAWAARGRVQTTVLERWLQEPYLLQHPPKSTGRELFGQADLQRRLADLAQTSAATRDSTDFAADSLATLTAFSAATVAQDLQRGPRPIELLVAGGGGRNQTLMRELRRRCRGMSVRPLQELGIGDLEREALAFALLAWWHQQGHPGSLPAVTGARQEAVLGTCARPAGLSPDRCG